MGSGKPSQAQQLLTLACEHYEFGISEEGRPFAVDKEAPGVAVLLRSKGDSLRASLSSLMYEAGQGVASQQALAEAMCTIEGIARRSLPRQAYLRSARVDNEIWIDTCAPAGEFIRIGPQGWSTQQLTPVLFRRSKVMAKMPSPRKDGSILELRRFLNVSDEDFLLLVGYLVGTFHTDSPRPALVLTGQQGSAKSMTAKILVELCDPSHAPLRRPPRHARDWAVASWSSSVICFDNLSGISDGFSDDLCRAISGEGTVSRELYSDDESIVLSFRNAILLTGIDLGALRQDLLDRVVRIELSPVSSSKRRSEREMLVDFSEAHPRILGALLSLVSESLHSPGATGSAGLPRMADYGQMLAVLEERTGVEYFGSYLRRLRETMEGAAADDILASAVICFLEDSTQWEGTATDLLEHLSAFRQDGLPRTPNHLSRRLQRSAPSLRACGIELSDRKSGGQRLLSLTRTRGTQDDKGR